MTTDLQREDAPANGLEDQDAAQAFYLRLAETLEELMATLDEEAALIRAAKLRDAAALAPRKAMIAEDYRRALDVLRDNAELFGRDAPQEVEELRQRHRLLERTLQSNLAVLATARTVSETLVKSVAETIGSKGPKPTTYGSNARRPDGSVRAGAIAVDVAL